MCSTQERRSLLAICMSLRCQNLMLLVADSTTGTGGVGERDEETAAKGEDKRRNSSRPPLWSSGQSSWLQIQRSGFDSRRYHIFREVVGLEQGPLSLVSTIEELLVRKCSGSGLDNREYGLRDPSR
jgi:hypothetical protein